MISLKKKTFLFKNDEFVEMKGSKSLQLQWIFRHTHGITAIVIKVSEKDEIKNQIRIILSN